MIPKGKERENAVIQWIFCWENLMMVEKGVYTEGSLFFQKNLVESRTCCTFVKN